MIHDQLSIIPGEHDPKAKERAKVIAKWCRRLSDQVGPYIKLACNSCSSTGKVNITIYEEEPLGPPTPSWYEKPCPKCNGKGMVLAFENNFQI